MAAPIKTSLFKRNLGLRTDQIRVAGEKVDTLHKAKPRGIYREFNFSGISSCSGQLLRFSII